MQNTISITNFNFSRAGLSLYLKILSRETNYNFIIDYYLDRKIEREEKVTQEEGEYVLTELFRDCLENEIIRYEEDDYLITLNSNDFVIKVQRHSRTTDFCLFYKNVNIRTYSILYSGEPVITNQSFNAGPYMISNFPMEIIRGIIDINY